MKSLVPLFCFLVFPGNALMAAGDPVAECRKAHANNPTEHIACLEAALQERSAPTVPPGSTAAETEASTVLGSEQVIQKKRASGEITEQPVAVQIIATQYNSAGQGIFKLDNGQIWRETEVTPRHLRLEPGNPYQATLERGAIGGYRMQVEGVRRMLKVERLK